jgi:CheY-like chemotaxis protein/CheY-specific phosphatase CheX
MDLTDLQLMIIAPFIDETIKKLDAMCGLEAYAGDPFLDEIVNFRFKGYAVASETTGKINGVILLHNYVETALAIGNRLRLRLLEETHQHDKIDEDMQSALSEWGNTIIGNATNFLADKNLGIKFAPPYFITNTENLDPLLSHAQEIISIPIHIKNEGRFYFNYIITGEASAVVKPGGILRNGKILVVDDSNFIRMVVKKYLRKIGYENTIEAANGREAIEMYKKEKPDIIFMDYVMPQMTGYEALQQIRLTDKKVPVVMFTSVSDQNVISECKALGISGYIIKPLTAEEGPEKLQEFLENPTGQA